MILRDHFFVQLCVSEQTGVCHFHLPKFDSYTDEALLDYIRDFRDDSVYAIFELLRRGHSIEELHQITMITELFLESYKKIVDHIDHVVRLVGVKHVGLGSDFDGIEACPDGLEDISKMQKVIIELRKRGYSDYEIRHIAGGNFLRVLEQVQRMSE